MLWFCNEVIYSPLTEDMFLFREMQAPTWLLLFSQNRDLGAGCERGGMTCAIQVRLLTVDVFMQELFRDVYEDL